MLVTIDKRGSINLPAAVRKELGLEPGSRLEVTVLDGGRVALDPVVVYPAVRLSADGLAKLQSARESGTGELPDWMLREMTDADPDPH